MADSGKAVSAAALVLAAAKSGGGGGTPSEYLKRAAVSGNTLTLTNKDDTTVTFTPTSTSYQAGEGINIANDTISVQSGKYVERKASTTADNLVAYADNTGLEKQVSLGSNLWIENNALNAKNDTYVAGNGLTLSDNTFTVDTGTISTVSYVDQSVTGLAAWSEVEEALADKQDTLIAGTNITINADNVISATAGEPATYIKDASVSNKTLTLTKKDDSTVTFTDTGSVVSVSDTGTATDEVGYITIDGVEKKIAGGGGSSYTFTNGLTESSGTVSWDLNDDIYNPTSSPNSVAITPNGKVNIYGPGFGDIVLGYVENNATNIHGATGCILAGMLQKNDAIYAGNSKGCLVGGKVDSTDSTWPTFCDSKNGVIAWGTGLIAGTDYSAIFGKFNISESDKLLTIGNGTSNSARSNAMTIDASGNEVLAGTITASNIPAPPSDNGTYRLTCTVTDGVVTYSWVAA